jgi:hypothetical protein
MIRRSAALAMLLACLLPAAAPAAGAPAYLTTRLRPSGGFAEAGSTRASVALTEWAVMGLAAAGRHPGRMHRPGGATPRRFLVRQAARWNDAYELERGILAAVAMGRSPRRFGGRDLVRALRRSVHARSGRIGIAANSTYWGVMALRASHARLPRRSLRSIRRAQAPGGGFGWAAGGPPDSNDTAAAIMALRSAGVSCGRRTVKGALRALDRFQRPGGGYALTEGDAPDAQSTAWAVQARDACGLRNRKALGWLARRKRPSGAYAFAPGDTRTPVWVTAQVLPAVHGRHYPVRG